MSDAAGSVLFAYDGSELAKHAISEGAALLGTDREAIVVTVWQPFNVGFVPAPALQFNAAQIEEVRHAAEHTAAEGASLAEAAGFRADSMAIEGAPAWKELIGVAEDRGSEVIVLGSHGRRSLVEAVLGSVAGAVASHFGRSVLIAHGTNTAD
jgi:nucleotide-binding universal stress UspA family protein